MSVGGEQGTLPQNNAGGMGLRPAMHRTHQNFSDDSLMIKKLNQKPPPPQYRRIWSIQLGGAI